MNIPLWDHLKNNRPRAQHNLIPCTVLNGCIVVFFEEKKTFCCIFCYHKWSWLVDKLHSPSTRVSLTLHSCRGWGLGNRYLRSRDSVSPSPQIVFLFAGLLIFPLSLQVAVPCSIDAVFTARFAVSTDPYPYRQIHIAVLATAYTRQA